MVAVRGTARVRDQGAMCGQAGVPGSSRAAGGRTDRVGHHRPHLGRARRSTATRAAACGRDRDAGSDRPDLVVAGGPRRFRAWRVHGRGWWATGSCRSSACRLLGPRSAWRRQASLSRWSRGPQPVAPAVTADGNPDDDPPSRERGPGATTGSPYSRRRARTGPGPHAVLPRLGQSTCALRPRPRGVDPMTRHLRQACPAERLRRPCSGSRLRSAAR